MAKPESEASSQEKRLARRASVKRQKNAESKHGNQRVRCLWIMNEDVVPLDAVSRTIAEELLKEIRARLRFLLDVGLHYLALDRAAPTLSGGEAQRIRLASQVGAGLVGVLYILDEPSIGLHPRTTTGCWQPCSGLRIRATRLSSSSTTKTRCARPTISSTSARAPASRGAR